MTGSKRTGQTPALALHAVSVWDKIGFGLLLAMLIWLPIPWGSEPGWSMSLAITWAFLIALLFALRGGGIGTYSGIKVPLMLFMLFLAYVFAQALPLGPLPLPPKLGEFPIIADARPASLSPSDTLERFLLYAAYLTCFLVTVGYVNTPLRARKLAYVVVSMGVLESVFGFYAYATGFEFVPRSLQDGHWHRLTGTFVNRNQFGAHLFIALSLAIGLLWSRAHQWQPRRGWRYWAGFLTGHEALLLGSVFVMTCALFYSGSRGASVVFMLSLSACMVVDTMLGKHRRRTRGVMLAVGLTMLLALLMVGTAGIYARLVSTGLDLGERLVEWRLIMPMLKDFYLLGSGAGTFEWSFPMYRDGTLRPLLYDHAHGDALENLAELGVVGFLLVFSAILMLVCTLFKTCYSKEKADNGIVFGCLIAVVAFLIQSLIDVNFQVPANGFYFFAILGAGVAPTTFLNGAVKQADA